MWKKKSTKTLLDHPRLLVTEDSVELPDGQVTEYLCHSSRMDGVTIIAQNKLSKILVSEEYSYPVNKKLWQFPGGGINPGEPPELAASRELREEGKLRPQSLRLLGSFYLNPRRSEERMFVYLAYDLESAPLEGDKEEVIKTSWLEIPEIDQLIQNGEIENSNTLSAWTLYKASN